MGWFAWDKLDWLNDWSFVLHEPELSTSLVYLQYVRFMTNFSAICSWLQLSSLYYIVLASGVTAFHVALPIISCLLLCHSRNCSDPCLNLCPIHLNFRCSTVICFLVLSKELLHLIFCLPSWSLSSSFILITHRSKASNVSQSAWLIVHVPELHRAKLMIFQNENGIRTTKKS